MSDLRMLPVDPGFGLDEFTVFLNHYVFFSQESDFTTMKIQIIVIIINDTLTEKVASSAI